jgi:hypothetical protein
VEGLIQVNSLRADGTCVVCARLIEQGLMRFSKQMVLSLRGFARSGGGVTVTFTHPSVGIPICDVYRKDSPKSPNGS